MPYLAEIRLFSKLVFIKEKWSKHSTQEPEKNCKGVKPKEIKRKEVIKMFEIDEIKNRKEKKLAGSLKKLIK